jgi:hypothetical protein
MNTEVGAGTLNPATALRVLGPEPWKVGYVEPSSARTTRGTATAPTGSRRTRSTRWSSSPSPATRRSATSAVSPPSESTCGREAFGQAEYEMSRYYLDEADVEAGRALFAAYEAEARRMIEARLPVPAHTYVLKCSHVFNVLDARGAVGTTERATAFARMRTLAHDVAGLWAARREELGHPLGDAVTPPAPERRPGAFPVITEPAPLAFEIGFEELPAAGTERVEGAVRDSLTELLAGTRLRHGEVRVMSGPRRVVAVVQDVHPREDDVERTVRGPRRSAAYGAEGAPTRAALGFARGQGADVADLRPVTVNGGDYVGLVRKVTGRRPPRCSPTCSPVSSPACAPTATCAGTPPACPTAARSAGSPPSSASTSSRSRWRRWTAAA